MCPHKRKPIPSKFLLVCAKKTKSKKKMTKMQNKFSAVLPFESSSSNSSSSSIDDYDNTFLLANAELQQVLTAAAATATTTTAATTANNNHDAIVANQEGQHLHLLIESIICADSDQLNDEVDELFGDIVRTSRDEIIEDFDDVTTSLSSNSDTEDIDVNVNINININDDINDGDGNDDDGADDNDDGTDGIADCLLGCFRTQRQRMPRSHLLATTSTTRRRHQYNTHSQQQ